MGEAKIRGTFEERKSNAVPKKAIVKKQRQNKPVNLVLTLLESLFGAK